MNSTPVVVVKIDEDVDVDCLMMVLNLGIRSDRAREMGTGH